MPVNTCKKLFTKGGSESLFSTRMNFVQVTTSDLAYIQIKSITQESFYVIVITGELDLNRN